MIVSTPQRLTRDFLIDLPVDPADIYELDASGLDFVEPAGLVHLALCLHQLASLASQVIFRSPSSYEVDCYLARMDFYNAIPKTVEKIDAVDPSILQRNDRRDVLVGLTPFKTSIQVEEIMGQVEYYLSHQGLPQGMTTAIWEILSELCDNAASHGTSQCGAFLAAQTYGNGKRYLAVGDLGVGIRAHLTRNPRYAGITSDERAIAMAIERDVTGTEDRRGYGLYDIQGWAAEVGNGKAELHVLSGVGHVTVAISGENRKVMSAACSPCVLGTLVEIILLD
jgi:anti-sigma regulatory factor (Ser/Thr protein kinase)